ncbi:hypothetical protein J6590_008475 [Homalodisca vitripennis]|nr:hypothetical protein J6590_008475 [Homalodisca vitripennis]
MYEQLLSSDPPRAIEKVLYNEDRVTQFSLMTSKFRLVFTMKVCISRFCLHGVTRSPVTDMIDRGVFTWVTAKLTKGERSGRRGVAGVGRDRFANRVRSHRGQNVIGEAGLPSVTARRREVTRPAAGSRRAGLPGCDRGMLDCTLLAVWDYRVMRRVLDSDLIHCNWVALHWAAGTKYIATGSRRAGLLGCDRGMLGCTLLAVWYYRDAESSGFRPNTLQLGRVALGCWGVTEECWVALYSLSGIKRPTHVQIGLSIRCEQAELTSRIDCVYAKVCSNDVSSSQKFEPMA